MDQSGPALSTPAENIIQETIDADSTRRNRLPDEQLLIQYEIKRTVDEIRNGKWKRIALQFPDDMLVDAPRICEILHTELSHSRTRKRLADHPTTDQVDSANSLKDLSLQDYAKTTLTQTSSDEDQKDARLTILGDTSYGACCVDEIAAEHVSAEVIVHYGRSCLSPTARLPVIYVFTSRPLDLDATVAAFCATYEMKSDKICLMADIPYQHNVPILAERLRELQYENLFATETVHDPASLLPNRTLPKEVRENPDALKEHSIFHIAEPPTALLLTLSSRVKRIHTYDPNATSPSASLESTSTILLRRRYAALLRLSSAAIIGILINTLSVKNYLSALSHIQSLISAAGKKYYTFVVGKLNTPKLANFAEVGGWVVIGCWESSLVDSRDFLTPVVTPFELETALMTDDTRVWGGEWISDFQALLRQKKQSESYDTTTNEPRQEHNEDEGMSEDDEPPEFDLRTGRYISHSRPMRRIKPSQATQNALSTTADAPPSSALVQRAKGDVATINGTVAPGAEFLRTKREWQGLGSDFEIAYDRDAEGKIQGAAVEEGRSGLARGYTAGTDDRS